MFHGYRAPPSGLLRLFAWGQLNLLHLFCHKINAMHKNRETMFAKDMKDFNSYSESHNSSFQLINSGTIK